MCLNRLTRLEAEVPFDVDDDRGRRVARDLPQHAHVLADERELLPRVWQGLAG